MPNDVSLSSHLERRFVAAIQSAAPKSVSWRHLSIALAYGRKTPQVAIADQIGRSPQAVSLVVRELREVGFEEFLRKKWPKPVRSQRQHPGARGLETLEDYGTSFSVDDLPIVDFVAWVHRGNAQAAILGVKPGSDAASQLAGLALCSKGSLFEAICSAFEAESGLLESTVMWPTISNFENTCAELFEAMGVLAREPEVRDYPDALDFDIAEINIRYEGFQFLVVSDVDSELGHILVDRLELPPETPRLTLGDGLTFVRRLEQVIYTLQQRVSGVGLLPSLVRFYDDFFEWLEEGEQRPLNWQSGGYWKDWVKASMTVSDYFAVDGWLFETNPVLWRRIAYSSRIPFRTFTHRTKVLVVSEDRPAGTAIFSISPLPEAAYEIEVPVLSSAKAEAALLRERINTAVGARKLVYAGGESAVGSRDRIAVPESFFLGKGTNIADGVNTVLVPRRLCCPLPPMGIDELSKVALGGRSAFRKLDSNEGPAHGFAFPDLLAIIMRAFVHGSYSAMWSRIKEHQAKVLKHTYKRDGSHPDHWAWSFLKLAGRATDGSGDVIEMLRPPAPPWDSEVRDQLLRNFDADFLIAGVGREDRLALERCRESWANLEAEVIVEWLRPNGQFNRQKIANVLEVAEKHLIADTEDWCSEILSQFLAKRQRVARWAIENAQRLLLGGFQPVPIVVQSDRALLRSWKSYLGLAFRGRFSDTPMPTDAEFDDGRFNPLLHRPEESDEDE